MSDTLNQYGSGEDDNDIDLAELEKAIPTMTHKELTAAADELGFGLAASGVIEERRTRLLGYVKHKLYGPQAVDITHNNAATLPPKPDFLTGADTTAAAPPAPLVDPALPHFCDEANKIVEYGSLFWRNPITGHNVVIGQADDNGMIDFQGYAVNYHVVAAYLAEQENENTESDPED